MNWKVQLNKYGNGSRRDKEVQNRKMMLKDTKDRVKKSKINLLGVLEEIIQETVKRQDTKK